jgi:hypothetical protein
MLQKYNDIYSVSMYMYIAGLRQSTFFFKVRSWLAKINILKFKFVAKTNQTYIFTPVNNSNSANNLHNNHLSYFNTIFTKNMST